MSATLDALRGAARRAVCAACNLNPYNGAAQEQADQMVESIVRVVLAEVEALRRQEQRATFAAAALQGLLANPGRYLGGFPVTGPADDAVALADALLAALDKPKETP